MFWHNGKAGAQYFHKRDYGADDAGWRDAAPARELVPTDLREDITILNP